MIVPNRVMFLKDFKQDGMTMFHKGDIKKIYSYTPTEVSIQYKYNNSEDYIIVDIYCNWKSKPSEEDFVKIIIDK